MGFNKTVTCGLNISIQETLGLRSRKLVTVTTYIRVVLGGWNYVLDEGVNGACP